MTEPNLGVFLISSVTMVAFFLIYANQRTSNMLEVILQTCALRACKRVDGFTLVYVSLNDEGTRGLVSFRYQPVDRKPKFFTLTYKIPEIFSPEEAETFFYEYLTVRTSLGRPYKV